jgi:hypothetical protein
MASPLNVHFMNFVRRTHKNQLKITSDEQKLFNEEMNMKT